MWKWFLSLFLPKRVDFDAFRPEGAAGAEDPRTVVVPLKDRPEGMDYFAVVNSFVKERVRLKKFLSETEPLNEEVAGDHGVCEFGMWLRFVEPPASKLKLLQSIATWHTQWHTCAKACARLHNEGRHEEARFLLHRGEGAIAAKRLMFLLEQFWDLPDSLREPSKSR